MEQVKRYIPNQKEHHRKMTFEDEFIGLLTKHGLAYDPRLLTEIRDRGREPDGSATPSSL